MKLQSKYITYSFACLCSVTDLSVSTIKYTLRRDMSIQFAYVFVIWIFEHCFCTLWYQIMLHTYRVRPCYHLKHTVLNDSLQVETCKTFRKAEIFDVLYKLLSGSYWRWSLFWWQASCIWVSMSLYEYVVYVDEESVWMGSLCEVSICVMYLYVSGNVESGGPFNALKPSTTTSTSSSGIKLSTLFFK